MLRLRLLALATLCAGGLLAFSESSSRATFSSSAAFVTFGDWAAVYLLCYFQILHILRAEDPWLYLAHRACTGAMRGCSCASRA